MMINIDVQLQKREERVRRDQELINGFVNHLKSMGFNYVINGFSKKNGVTRGIGVDIWIYELGKKIKLILNHGRNSRVSLSDKCEIDRSSLCVVISSSEKNNLGYISKGIETKNIKNVMEESGGTGWRRRIKVNELRDINIKRWLV